MGLIDIFIGRKKRTRKATRSGQKTVKKRKKIQKATAIEQIENPVMTVSRQLTLLQRSVDEVNSVMRSGFSGLREDHHKILDEQATKQDVFLFREYLENQKEALNERKEKIEREIELIETDRELLENLEKGKKSSNELAKRMGIVRQYASQRLNKMVELGFIEKIRRGRNVYYKLKKR